MVICCHIYTIMMTKKVKSQWIHRIIKRMKPKRCGKSMNEDQKQLNATSSRPDLDCDGHQSSTNNATSSSKKLRSSCASTPTAATSSLTGRDMLNTPPPTFHSMATSPPRLERRYNSYQHTTENSLEHQRIAPLPILPLPSELLRNNNTHPTSISLNPRLQWNAHAVTQQTRGRERTLSSLLNLNSFLHISPPDTPTNAFSSSNIIRPIPRYGSLAVNSNNPTVDCDNTTFIDTLNSIADESCCAWFSPSWTSAFDVVVPKDPPDERSSP